MSAHYAQGLVSGAVPPDPAPRLSVAIVGGGIAGLYCARELLGGGECQVTVFEQLNHLGGRIETDPDFSGFNAEFGPMRFEPELQPVFSRLCDELGVKLVYFPGPGAAEREGGYQPEVAEDERDSDGQPLDPLQLLKLGVFRMFDKKPTNPADGYLDARTRTWLQTLDLLPTHRPNGTPAARSPARARGAPRTRTADWIRRYATVPGDHLDMQGTPWHKLGFWNALSEVLSHEAILRIRDFGTFYHLIPDNPNAAEWAIFWLRLFQLGNKPLATVRSGVYTIIEKLESELRSDPAFTLCTGCEVTGVSPAGDERKLALRLRKTGDDRIKEDGHEFDHVILAIPQYPLTKLADDLPETVTKRLDSVIGFPLLKTFAVLRDPWWLRESPPAKTKPPVKRLMMNGKIPLFSQRGAGKIPTRETHYYVRPQDNLGMMMLYTDHPATEYWKTLVPSGEDHTEARLADSTDEIRELRGALAHYLRYDQAHQSGKGASAAEAHPRVADENSIIAYAIRDWSRPPFGAGCHAWRPGSESWNVRKAFKTFAAKRARSDTGNLHICGEAYSDYQGFIEGALQSAVDALLTIDVKLRSW